MRGHPSQSSRFLTPGSVATSIQASTNTGTFKSRHDCGNVSIFDLSPAEKLQLVEDLWDELASTPESVPVHDWQRDELARRKANLTKNPTSGLSWEEVKRRVRSRYGR